MIKVSKSIDGTTMVTVYGSRKGATTLRVKGQTQAAVREQLKGIDVTGHDSAARRLQIVKDRLGL